MEISICFSLHLYGDLVGVLLETRLVYHSNYLEIKSGWTDVFAMYIAYHVEHLNRLMDFGLKSHSTNQMRNRTKKKPTKFMNRISSKQRSQELSTHIHTHIPDNRRSFLLFEHLRVRFKVIGIFDSVEVKRYVDSLL